MKNPQYLDPVRVRQYPGVAFRYTGLEYEDGQREIACPECDGGGCHFCDCGVVYDNEPEPVPTGNWCVCMVGDDKIHVVDPDDVTPLDEEEFCPSCGQIGCSHGRV